MITTNGMDQIRKYFFQYIKWTFAMAYLLLRRHTVTSTIVALNVALILLSLKWGLLCLNVQSRSTMKQLCTSYTSRWAVGSLCSSLCKRKDIRSFSCNSFQMGKQSVITAIWNNTELILKQPQPTTIPFETEDNPYTTHSSSQLEFRQIIKDNIFHKFNVTLSDRQIRNMIKKYFMKKEALSLTEMKNLWILMQDNEYLTMILYEKYEIFPKLLGSCGNFYATEKADPIFDPSIISSYIFAFDKSLEEWKRRVMIAIKIMKFIDIVDNIQPEPLVICDSKINHFALSKNLKNIKYIDLDLVFPKSQIDSMVADHSKCTNNKDCDFFDCRSFCNKVSGKCDQPLANNNLQIICQKIFLGWNVSGRILVPGLLLGPHTPGHLVHLLQNCANPNYEIAQQPLAILSLKKNVNNALIDLSKDLGIKL